MLDLSKPIQTRDGRLVELIGVSKNPNVELPIAGIVSHESKIESWSRDGSIFCDKTKQDRDLINVPEKIVRWVNAYENCAYGYDSLNIAKCNRLDGCIACIRIEFTRGQYDE